MHPGLWARLQAFWHPLSVVTPDFPHRAQAVPVTKDFTQGQLQPAAQAIAEQAMPTAKKITDDNLRPAAQAIAEKVRIRS